MRAQKPRFFKSPAEFRAWLAKNHAKATELLVGYHKKHTGKPSLTWEQSVDEALCFGWIDGIRRSGGADTYTIRFTPRTATSKWSAVNIKRVGELTRLQLMTPAGHRAFEARKQRESGEYSYEQRTVELPEPYARSFRKHAKAWAFFQHQTPGYRKISMWWIVSAKREDTRMKRLTELIALSERQRLIPGINLKPRKLT
ncbi:MAG TPA: YdeI/OmpD-associated family protein [Gemmatimonadaceae bacterium]|nr:YdeI/OmpD-associated family protein [Gemmatimonadaceae bacterium]